METTLLTVGMFAWLLSMAVSRLAAEVRRAPVAIQDEQGFHIVRGNSDQA